MSPYEKAGLWFTRLTLPDGRQRVVSMGTTDKVTATAIERMVKTLATRRQWAALEAVVEKRASLGRVYDAYELGTLGDFLKRLDDPDLDALVTEWAETARSAKYVIQVRRMIPEGARYPASDFTRGAVSRFLAGLTVSGSTKNRYRAALSVFAGWLVEREVIPFNPIVGKGVRGAKENPPRDKWLSTADAIRVCDAVQQPFRSLFALLYGAGLEVSAALRVSEDDIDRDAATVHVRGTKTPWRNRVVVVPAWAMQRLIRTGLHGPLFRLSYMDAYKRHRDALEAVKLEGYTMHDARHSYAVNALRSGLRPEVVAHQLGHKDAALVHKVYGRFIPDASDYATPAATSKQRRIP